MCISKATMCLGSIFLGAEKSCAVMWPTRVRVWGRQDEGEVEPYLAHLSSHCKRLHTKPVVQFSLWSRAYGMGALNVHSSCRGAGTASFITEKLKCGFCPLLKKSVK